jgi:hypothetical protein
VCVCVCVVCVCVCVCVCVVDHPRNPPTDPLPTASSSIRKVVTFEFSGVGLSGMLASMIGAVTAHMLSSLSDRNDAV